MATLVATSPPSLNMDSVFASSHAPPSPAYSSTPAHPPSPLSPKQKLKDEAMTLSTPYSSMSSSSASASAQATPSTATNNASMTPVLRGDAPAAARPAKDLAAFNSLLPPPVEFVEGSSSGAFASSLEGRYEPINASPKAAPRALNENQSKPKSTPTKRATSEQKSLPSLHARPIELSWPSANVAHGSGLYNIGNTCFLNSALQCLLHTPPLLRMLLLHKGAECRVKSGFCMSCSLRQVMQDSFEKRRTFTPLQITRNLNFIAKHFKRGRQEDSHEFLRYAIDSLQKSCLAGYPSKIDHKLAETTWVHKIFGGRLRSRVTCQQCGYNSDTFDSILDLSVDIYNMSSLKEALKRFTAKDYLKGADKYKCEKCKRPVNAEKQFTIHDAPAVLTVHLKRFTPMGRKLQHPIRYDERLNLQAVMSEGQHGPTYTLYGVISHMGSGPNHGHYFAHVRGADGQWYEMNDESVERAYRQEVLNMKNAYMLFYIREKGQALAAAVNNVGPVNGLTPSKKRKVPSEDEPERERESDDVFRDEPQDKTTRPFIGPVLPPHLSRPDPQSDVLKRKIEAAERERKERSTQVQRPQSAPRRQLKPLVEYDDASDEEEQGERVERPNAMTNSEMTQNNGIEKEKEGSGLISAPRDGTGGSALLPSSSPSSQVAASGSKLRGDGDGDPDQEDTSSPGRPPPTSPLPATSPAESVSISPSNFYGSSTSSSSSGKRKSPDGDGPGSDEYTSKSSDRDRWKEMNGTDSATSRSKPYSSTNPTSFRSKPVFSMSGGNPFGKSRIGDNLHSERDRERDEERELFRPRKVPKKQFGRPKFGY